MVRKSQKAPFESISPEVAASIIMAASGSVKGKAVDPRKQIGTVHIKKYLAIERINSQFESWIRLLRKRIESEKDGGTPYEFSAEEQASFESCKQLTAAYLEEEGSDALKEKVNQQTNELERLKSVASSMKYKFSTFSFEVITHMINLMVRELLVFTCDSCLSRGSKLTKEAHVPWAELQGKMLSGLYMNTPLVYASIHGLNEEPETTETENEAEAVVEDEPEPESTDAEADVEEDTDSTEVKPKKFRPKLTQYVNNAFKEIISREPRFTGLLLGKEVITLVNTLVYQVLDRYVNVIKSLLLVGSSKTITDHLALIATQIILRDDIHTSEPDVKVILDVVQDRIDSLKKDKDDKTKKDPVVDTPTPTESTVDAAPAKAKRGKKKEASA